jgi:hypothetical protein
MLALAAGVPAAASRAVPVSDGSNVDAARAAAATAARSAVSIRALCAALRRIEKRHEP